MRLEPTGNPDGDNNIENAVAYQVIEKEVNKGLGAFLIEFFNAQDLGLLTHSDHKLGFAVVFDKKDNGPVNFAVKAHKGIDHKLRQDGLKNRPPKPHNNFGKAATRLFCDGGRARRLYAGIFFHGPNLAKKSRVEKRE